ncbi:unnamed protein product [Gulo gulo]|uniref:Uncharacterized protein n=1 Tax=Gulo gulo TaxID=48420 RepID=A0A9X9LVU8_GULGU|nr:unnamed protein product [Gulo gulo]
MRSLPTSMSSSSLGQISLSAKEQMATPGGSDTSLCLLAWQCGPSGSGHFCSQDSHISRAAAMRVCSRPFLSVVETSPVSVPPGLQWET